MFFFYFNLIFEYKLVILIYFFFVNGEIKLTYLLTYLLTELSSRCNDREQCSQDRLKKKTQLLLHLLYGYVKNVPKKN